MKLAGWYLFGAVLNALLSFTAKALWVQAVDVLLAVGLAYIAGYEMGERDMDV